MPEVDWTASSVSVTLADGTGIDLQVPRVRRGTHRVRGAALSVDDSLVWVALEFRRVPGGGQRDGADEDNDALNRRGVHASIFSLPSGALVAETTKGVCSLVEVSCTLYPHPVPGKPWALIECAAGQDGVETFVLHLEGSEDASNDSSRGKMAVKNGVIGSVDLPGFHAMCLGWDPAGERVAIVGHDDTDVWVAAVSPATDRETSDDDASDDDGKSARKKEEEENGGKDGETHAAGRPVVTVYAHEDRDDICRRALCMLLDDGGARAESEHPEEMASLREGREAALEEDAVWATGNEFEVVGEEGFFMDMYPGDVEVVVRITLSWNLQIVDVCISPSQL